MAQSTEGHFDTVAMVDWSGAATPTTGVDSIWICCQRTGADEPETLTNPPTRRDAMAELTRLSEAEIAAGRRLMIGFDFPFGYPNGFAADLAAYSGATPDWKGVWHFLADAIQDGPRNRNNRFEVAAELNCTLYNGEGPFWGCPPRRPRQGLPMRKPEGYGSRYPAERRLIETRIPRTQPCWKLFTTGSVGSQALMGIAALERFRRALAPNVGVWLDIADTDAPVQLVEIYPSLLSPDPRESVKDAGQVRAMAAAYASPAVQRQALALPPDLSTAELRQVRTEELWIAGAAPQGSTTKLPK
ncbi:MAG: molybdopterin guanine dinucleotide synthesis [Pseudomonadota bacterium]